MAYTPRPARLLPDSWDQDKHQSLKRWERATQRSAWKARAQERGAPPLPCPWRDPGRPYEVADPVSHGPAHVLALFEGGLALVRFAGHLESTAGVRVLRGALPWDQWTPIILRAWMAGAPVPDPFRPRRRLPPQWLEQALAGSEADQKAFFDRLREAGILKPLAKISAEGVAPWLAWDEVRARFVDFTGNAA
jgi:hypothetical protein